MAAISQYQKAFYYLSGHEYTPELWIQLMGPIKLSRFYPAAAQGLARHRPWRSPSPRPVSESVLHPGRKDDDRPNFLEAVGGLDNQFGLVDMAMDVQTLISSGKSDKEICEKLEMSMELGPEFISEIRSRCENR